MTAILARVGTCALASLFVLGGLNKVLDYQATLQRMEEAGLTPAAFLLPLTIALELGGGLAVMFGRWPSVVAAGALAVFTLSTNVVFHRFWEMTGPVAELELSLFFKNIAIAGGLLFFAAQKWNDTI